MSFPRLKLTAGVGARSISAIELEYENDGAIFTKPEGLKRLKYDVKRQTRILNVSQGTAANSSNLAYDQYRLVHTWIGYVDVITESVTVTALSTTQDLTNVALLRTAAVLETGSTVGIPYVVSTFLSEQLGPDKSSLSGLYTDSKLIGLDWVYKKTSTAESTTNQWLIRDTSIVDNNDNTSRVSFTFELIEPWENLADVITVDTTA